MESDKNHVILWDFFKNAYFGQGVLSALNVLTDMIDLMRWSRAWVSILGYYEKRSDNLTIHNIFPTNAELAGCRSESQSGIDGDKFAITTGTIIIWWQRTYLRNVRHRKQLYETEQLIFLRKRANRANLNIRYRRFASYVSSRAGGDVVFDVFVPF